MADIETSERPSRASRAMRQAIRDALGFCAEHPDAAAADDDADAAATISPERKPVVWKPWPEPQSESGSEHVGIRCPEYVLW